MRTIIVTVILSILGLAVFSQKTIDNEIDFDYVQLPLTPFAKEVDGYNSELIIGNEEELQLMLEESKVAFEREFAEKEERKANAMAEYEYKRDHFDEFVEQAKMEHDVQLEAYKKILDGMGMFEKLAYKENNKPPKFVMPKKPTSPPVFRDPVYRAPEEAEILGKKDVLDATYLRIDGYKEEGGNPVLIRSTIHAFESKEPRIEEISEKYYDKTAKAYKVKVRRTTVTEAKYPVSIEVMNSDGVTQIFDEVMGGEYVAYNDKSQSAIKEDLLDKNMKQVLAVLNDNFGYSTQKRATVLYTIKAKKFEYPDYQQAFEKAMSYYNTLKYDDTDMSENLKGAISIWEEALKSYDPNDSKARINQDIALVTYFNLIEANIWLGEFDKANMYITKMYAFKMKNTEEKTLESYKDFVADQKERVYAQRQER